MGVCLFLVAASYPAFVSLLVQFTCLLQESLHEQWFPPTLSLCDTGFGENETLRPSWGMLSLLLLFFFPPELSLSVNSAICVTLKWLILLEANFC